MEQQLHRTGANAALLLGIAREAPRLMAAAESMPAEMLLPSLHQEVLPPLVRAEYFQSQAGPPPSCVSLAKCTSVNY